MGFGIHYAEKFTHLRDVYPYTPANQFVLTGTTHGLRDAERNEYLIYDENAGSFTLSNLPAGTYEYEWFDPAIDDDDQADCIVSSGSFAHGGGDKVMTAPASSGGYDIGAVTTGSVLWLSPSSTDPFWVALDGSATWGTDCQSATKPSEAAAAVLPDSFFWAGLQAGTMNEYFFLMWFRHGRRFWFHDHYGAYLGAENVSEKYTRQRLDQALERWETTTEDVFYSELTGWFNSETSRFEWL